MSLQNTKTSITEAFQNSVSNFIDQLPQIAMGILIVVLGILIAGWIGRFARRRISARTEDPLMSKFLGTAIRYTFIIIAIMLALRAAGLGGIAAGILTAAGASAVVLGFAFKDIGENFIAGIILAFNRPFDVDDTVEIGSNFGKVKTLRSQIHEVKNL